MAFEHIRSFATGMHRLGEAARDRAWHEFAASAAAVGGSRVVVARWQRLTPVDSDEIVFSNAAPSTLERFKHVLDGSSPLRRSAWRQPESFLVSKVKTFDRRLVRTWLAALRAAPGSDLFVVPARWNESLLSVAFVTGPMIRFDSLTCAMLTVAAHAAAFRSEFDRDGDGAALTAREQACLGLAARGRSGGQIAVQLNISARTVRFHLDNAREKLGVATRGAATRKALTLGLIEVPNDR